jgi:hypothetical protein
MGRLSMSKVPGNSFQNSIYNDMSGFFCFVFLTAVETGHYDFEWCSVFEILRLFIFSLQAKLKRPLNMIMM